MVNIVQDIHRRTREYGQGFSVVATEARNLAQRSKRAAESIRDLIEKSEKGVAEGSGSTTRSVSLLSDAVVGIERVVAQVEEALERVDAQSQGIEMVASSVESVHQASDDNAQAARDLVARSVGDVAA